MSDPIRSFGKIMDRIRKATEDAGKASVMKATGDFTVGLIVKRTRLGYGVAKDFGSKASLKKLSEPYKESRKKFKGLSPTTTAGKSNLTRTGQMLQSVKTLRTQNGRVAIGPSGTRRGSSLTNAEVAGYQEDQGRPFNRVSELEYKQVLRFYRRQFGDLLKKRKLIR